MKPDINQEKIINSDNNLLVIASAGCGKTTTIINKINRILSFCNENEILVVSFTNETVTDLKNKLPSDIDIYTFHKLALKILQSKNIHYKLVSDNLLKYIIDEYFYVVINKEEKVYLLKLYNFLNFESFKKSSFFFELKETIETYIKLIKTYNYNIKDFLKDSNVSILHHIIYKIYYLYESEKNSQNFMSLDDIIINATNLCKSYNFKYKYIFVDEFQDTSQIRFDLIYNIFLNSNSIINFFGDDYQSIYAFSGCKLSIMINISKYIPDIKTLYLSTNYRSDYKLIKLANNFVSKNTFQMKKEVFCNKSVNNSVNIIYFKNLQSTFNSLINTLSDDILILSRYNNDLSLISSNHKKLTIHQAKGLEADYVIIINNKNGYDGFPSKYKKNKLLKEFDLCFEPIKYAEERRLFYVALTRAKKKVFLLTPYFNESAFIKELKKMLK